MASIEPWVATCARRAAGGAGGSVAAADELVRAYSWYGRPGAQGLRRCGPHGVQHSQPVPRNRHETETGHGHRSLRSKPQFTAIKLNYVLGAASAASPTRHFVVAHSTSATSGARSSAPPSNACTLPLSGL